MVGLVVSKALLLKLMVLAQATMVAMGEEEIVSEMDMTTSLGEESAGADTPRLFKVIAKDSEGQFPVEEGWQLVSDDDTLLYDQHFLNQFLDTLDMNQDFNAFNLAFVEGRTI